MGEQGRYMRMATAGLDAALLANLERIAKLRAIRKDIDEQLKNGRWCLLRARERRGSFFMRKEQYETRTMRPTTVIVERSDGSCALVQKPLAPQEAVESPPPKSTVDESFQRELDALEQRVDTTMELRRRHVPQSVQARSQVADLLVQLHRQKAKQRAGDRGRTEEAVEPRAWFGVQIPQHEVDGMATAFRETLEACVKAACVIRALREGLQQQEDLQRALQRTGEVDEEAKEV